VFLAATATKAAIYLIVRFVFDVFPDGQFGEIFLRWILAPLAAAAVIIGSLQAIFAKEVRRILAFSSVAQVGFILLGVSLATAAGISAGVYYLIAHALLKGALFMAVGAFAMSVQARTVDDFAGIAREAPWSAVAFGVGAASLAGVPMTMGFLAKWALIAAALESGAVWIAVTLAIGSLLTLIYVGRMMEAIFFRAPAAGGERAREAPVGVLVPLFILAGLSLWFGVASTLPSSMADASAAAVLGAAP
jgi:multicomponent Na+:H+ antiporter subunit D